MAHILLILACVFGFFMAWGVGANDVANAMGTSVGARALTVKQAIAIAMVFRVRRCLPCRRRSHRHNSQGYTRSNRPRRLTRAISLWHDFCAFSCGHLAFDSEHGRLAGLNHAFYRRRPRWFLRQWAFSVDAVNWGKVSQIVASWVVSPVLAGVISFGLFMSVQRLIINTATPFENAKKYVPYYIFAVGFMIAMVTLLKGFKHIGVAVDYGFESKFANALPTAALVGLVVAGLGILLLRNIKVEPVDPSQNRFVNVEKVFSVLMIFTACAMAFAHGSNDVANAIGPLAAVVGVIKNEGVIVAKSALPNWVLLLGAAGIAIGLATYGFKVMATIGRKITELTPSRGFAAELGAATTVVFASATGLPISTTHTLVGAVLGVGMARGIGALNLRVVGTIFMSWVITLPAGAALAILFFFFFKGIFG